jgi:rieske iron-sulfur protein
MKRNESYEPVGGAVLDNEERAARRACRRQVLGAGVAAALVSIAGRVHADADEEARSRRPAAGDQFVFFEGENQGKVIAPDDIKLNATQTLVWPHDPEKKVALDGSRLNLMLLIRLDPASLSDAEKPHAADGIVAYSAVCTHAGCPVSAWMAKEQVMLCPCHQSEYDPKDVGKAVFGPAPRALAAVPLKISGGVQAAARGFIGRVGIAPMT